MAIGGINGSMPAGAASDLGALLQQKTSSDIDEMKRRKKIAGQPAGASLTSPAVMSLSGMSGGGY